MKQKTAMMQLIDLIKKDIENASTNGYETDEYLDALHGVLFDAENLIEEEKDQIYEAFLGGWNEEFDLEEGETIPEVDSPYYKYYKETYEQVDDKA